MECSFIFQFVGGLDLCFGELSPKKLTHGDGTG